MFTTWKPVKGRMPQGPGKELTGLPEIRQFNKRGNSRNSEKGEPRGVRGRLPGGGFGLIWALMVW